MTMGKVKTLAVALIAAGVLGLTFRSFTYTKGTETTKLGPIEFSVKEKETVTIPPWLGVTAVAAGTGLLLYAGRKS